MIPSDIDTTRFGFAVGKAYGITEAAVPEVLAQCRSAGLRLLLARCDSGDWRTVHALEASGFMLMDTLLYLRRGLEGAEPGALGDSVRVAVPTDADAIARVAREAFTNYVGHYHADPRLDASEVAEIYPSWARRAAVDRSVADRVLVATVAGEVAGFAALKRIDAESLDGMLYGVAPSHRGRGLYRALLVESIGWAAQQGYRWMEYSTQLANLAALKTVVRMGFVPHRSSYTFHKWFD